MCRKLFFLMSLVFVLGLAGSASADLVAHWMLDEDSGTTAADESGNGNDGTLFNGPVWQPTAGQLGGALQFDGADDYVDAPHIPLNSRSFTVTMWVKPVWDTDDEIVFSQGPSGGLDNQMHFRISYRTGPPAEGLVRMGFYSNDLDSPWGPVADNTWYHITFWYDYENPTSPIRRIYLNGVPVAEDNGTPYLGTTGNTRIGMWVSDQWFGGMIDDVRVYNHALTEKEIQDVIRGVVYEARDPNPADGAEDVSIETNLTWTRGDGARWDKVYFGTDPCDANLSLVATIPDYQAAEYDPGDPNLLPSTTYYWYITEVNGPNEYPGPVWSFSTIPGEAQCSYPTDGTVIPGDPYPPDTSILYTELIFSPGPTAVKHTGYLSKDPDKVANRAEDANLGPPPLAVWPGYEYKYFAGHPSYYPYEGLIRGQVYYWTVDETDSFGNVYPGDVWEFAVQDFYAFIPSPPNEAIFIDTDVLLSWLEGYGAQNHDVFIGTSWEDVNNAYFDFSTPSDEYEFTTSSGINYYQMNGLDPETRYYWRIDEVQGRFPPSVGTIYKGPVWEFTTGSANPGLTGEYYHWLDPSVGGAGNPGPSDPYQSKVLVRIDPNVNFNWDTGSPPGVRPDGFSVRWTGQIAVPTKGETYTFTTETDDGVRLWVNDQLIIDQWINQGPTQWSGSIQLDDFGPYNIEMEYYENGGGAVARLYWESSSITPSEIIPENFLAPNLEAFTAYGPYPRDGSLLTNWTPILRWGPALFAETHNLYFSTDFDEVSERSVTPISLTDPCYHSPRLDLDQTYYWAVDGVNTLHGNSPWEGDVWSFTIPHGGVGSVVREWWLGISGTAISALTGDARYPDSPTGQELVPDFDGPLNWADNYGSRLHGWLRPPTTGEYKFWISTDDQSQLWLSSDAEPGNVGTEPIAQQTASPWDRYNWDAAPERESNSISLEAGKKYYIAGLQKEGGGGDHIAVAWQGPADSPIPERVIIDGAYLSPTPHDPPEAYGPYPADGATNVEDRSPVLSWWPGFHVQANNGHQLYFSASFADVNERKPAAYKGALTETNYPYPPPPLLLDRTYYWAVDEVNSLGPAPYIWKGRVWSFTTALCIALDNMEDYNDRGQIRGVWTDGYASVGWGGTYPFKYPLNTASSGSNLNVSTEVDSPIGGATGPIHGGTQAMVLLYENDSNTYTRLAGEEEWVYDSAKFSEIEANTVENLGVGQNWSGEGAKSLTMWFQGHPISDGSSEFGGWPEFSVTGRGRDIQGGHDEFYFLCLYPWEAEPLSTTTHIQTRVVSMDNTDPWAKAGLMIREKMTPYSKYAAVFVTPDNGITFQWRDAEGGTTGNVTETARTVPQYLKLQRTAIGAFIASYSTTGETWDWADVNVSEDPDVTFISVPMDDPCLYAGVAVTSHDAAELCTADFNNWDAYPWPSTWVWGNVGLNDPEQLYVALEDTVGNISVVEHSDVNAATLTSWQEWNVKLTDFTTVDLNAVKKVRIGLGDRVTQPSGGSGALYIDDIRACPPRCVWQYGKPIGDIAEPYDCIVDEKDLRVLAGDWLLRDEVITTVAPSEPNLLLRWAFDTGFGAVAYDSAGTTDGTIAGADWTSPGSNDAGYCLNFDGLGDYVQVPDPNDANDLLDGLAAISVSIWVKSDVIGTEKGFISGEVPHGSDETVTMRYDSAGASYGGTNVIKMGLVTTGGDLQLESSSNVQTTDWQQLVMTWSSGQEIRFYIDGLEDTPTGRDAGVVGTITDVEALIVGKGGKDTATNQSWDGLIDDVRIYDYALSKEEVAYLGTDGEPGLHIPIPSPADLYDDEPQGSQWINLKDYSLLTGSWLEKILWP